MAADFFRIYRGLELDEAAQFLTGAGAPGAGGDTADAPRGSFFTDTATGDLYLKTSQGTGTDKWRRMATQDYVSSVASVGLSWREPVHVIDTASSSVAALKADLDADDQIQGIGAFSGMRILGSTVTGNANIFVVSGSTGDWTLTEDLNLETPGDTVFVIGGNGAGRTYQYSGSAWTWINNSDQTELAFLRAYVGKDGVGSELPDYTSNNIVADNDSLETAIGKLDAEAARLFAFIGKSAAGTEMPAYASNNYVNDGDSLETGISNVDAAIGNQATEITSIQTYLGKTAGDGTPDYTSNNHVVDNTSVTAAISALDSEIGAAVSDGEVVQDTNTVNANIQALDAELASINDYLGKTVGDGTPDYTSNAYVADGDTLPAAISKLDAALAATSANTTASNVTSTTVVDTATGMVTAEWNVFVQSVSTPSKIRSFKIFAHINGTTVDHTTFAALKQGGNITGLNATVVQSGGAMQLSISSTEAVNVRAQRLSAIPA